MWHGVIISVLMSNMYTIKENVFWERLSHWSRYDVTTQLWLALLFRPKFILRWTSSRGVEILNWRGTEREKNIKSNFKKIAYVDGFIFVGTNTAYVCRTWPIQWTHTCEEFRIVHALCDDKITENYWCVIKLLAYTAISVDLTTNAIFVGFNICHYEIFNYQIY